MSARDQLAAKAEAYQQAIAEQKADIAEGASLRKAMEDAHVAAVAEHEKTTAAMTARLNELQANYVLARDVLAAHDAGEAEKQSLVAELAAVKAELAKVKPEVKE